MTSPLSCRPEELLIHTIAGLLGECRHIAVGVLSPIPGSAAILASTRTGAEVSIIGSALPRYRSNGGVDLFDSAAQGRIDAFFLSGGQIDGQANINLTGIGDYPDLDVRWSGAFGSAFLYFTVPRVILFRQDHTRRIFVPKVDFISSPGISPPDVVRPGGPYALVTGLCVMMFDRSTGRFRLHSVHAGHSVEEVRDNTGFDFDCPDHVPETVGPSPADLETIRQRVAPVIADPYPKFADTLFGTERNSIT